MAAYFGIFIGSLVNPVWWAVAYLLHLFMIKSPPRTYFLVTVVALTIVRTSLLPEYEDFPSNVIHDGFIFFLSSCVMASTFAYLIKRKQERAPEEVDGDQSHPIDAFNPKDKTGSEVDK